MVFIRSGYRICDRNAYCYEDLPFLSERKVKLTKRHSNYEFDEITRAHRKVYKTFNINPEPDKKLIASVRDKKKSMCYTYPLSNRHCVMV